MDGIDVSRGGDMEFVRGSIVSYPVICTPSHSFASVSLISSTYQSRSHVLAACSTRRRQFHHLTRYGSAAMVDIFSGGRAQTDLLIRAHTQEHVPNRVVVDIVAVPTSDPLSTSLSVGAL